MHVYELITCVRQANENAGNLISVVQFLINTHTHTHTHKDTFLGFISLKVRSTPFTISKRYQVTGKGLKNSGLKRKRRITNYNYDSTKSLCTSGLPSDAHALLRVSALIDHRVIRRVLACSCVLSVF